MKLKRLYPLDKSNYRDTAGYWRTFDGRFSIIRTLKAMDDNVVFYGGRERSWIIIPSSGNNAEGEQAHADRALLKSVGLLQLRFKTRKAAVAALELALAEVSKSL